MNNVIGLFDSLSVADSVVNDLVAAGFRRSEIEVERGDRSDLRRELISEGVLDEDADYYIEGLKQGGALVIVRADEAQTEEAVELMNRYANTGGTGSEETSLQEARLQDTTTSALTSPATSRPTSATERVEDEARLEVVEEQLRIGKRQVSRGGVRVRRVITERPVEEQVTLRDETIQVERQRIDRPVNGRLDDLFTERTIEVTEVDEEAVIAKEARVVEEVVVGKTVEERVETVRDSVRRTDVEVEQLAGSGATSEVYDETSPAYTYGQTLASDSRYTGREWTDIEADARRDWESSNEGTWENFKDSVRNSWERTRGRR